MNESIMRLVMATEQQRADVAPTYDEWVRLCFACASLGEEGRSVAHRLSQFSPKYNVRDTDRQFDQAMRSGRGKVHENTLFYLCKQAGVTLPRPLLNDFAYKFGQNDGRGNVGQNDGRGDVGQNEGRSNGVADILDMRTGMSKPNSQVQQSAENQEEADNLYITPHILAGRLPNILSEAISIADTPATQDMLLLSCLTAISYALPSFVTYHGAPRHRYQANMMTMVVAPPASGKGVMNWCRMLLAPIHNELKENYRLEMADYEDAVKCDVAGDRPKRQMTFVPVNSSMSVFLQQLNDNEGSGFAIATEMDTLSQTWGQDYGQYSDVFRCAFEHEAVSQRRRKDDEYFEIENPCLSVLLSGTPNQLAPLIKSRANGLSSRFACYVVRDMQPFNEKVFDADLPDTDAEHAHEDAYSIYKKLGTQLKQLWKWQHTTENKDRICSFVFSNAQRQVLKRLFLGQYKAYMDQLGPLYDPTVKRMAVIVKRIGLILSALRLPIGGALPKTMVCTDEDFQTVLLVANKLMLHAGLMFQMLPSVNEKSILQQGSLQCQQMLLSLPEEFSTEDVYAFGKQLGICERTIRRWLDKWIKNNKIKRNKRGKYKCERTI